MSYTYVLTTLFSQQPSEVFIIITSKKTNLRSNNCLRSPARNSEGSGVDPSSLAQNPAS